MLWHFSWFQPRNHHDDDEDFTFNALESIVCIQVALHVSDGEVLWKTCQLLIGRTRKKKPRKNVQFSHFFSFCRCNFFFIFVVYLFKALGTSRNTLFFLVNYFFFFRTDRYILVHFPTFYSTWILYDCSYNSRKKRFSLSLLHFFVLSSFC